MAEPVRLQRFLAAAGVAARRKAETMITEGRVSVNGKVVRVLGTKIDPAHDSVTVDGEGVYALDYFYVLLNKPKGCITAVSDDRGRPTVMDYLPNLPVPVKPVGRLDFYTEGVLLLTNDGELAARLLAPANHVPKTYHAKVHGQVTPAQLTKLRAGIVLEDGTLTQPAEVALLPSESKHSWVAVTIFEGKHHQVHRMFEALGFRVDKLQRVAFANLTFHHVRIGDARELTQQELNELRDAVELPRGPVARGRWRASREATDFARRARAKVRAEADDAAAAMPGAEPTRTAEQLVERSAEPADRDRSDRGARPARGGHAPRGRDDRAPRGRDDRAPRGRDDRAPRGRDDRAPRGRDDLAPRGRDDRAPRGRDDRAPRGRDDRAAPRGRDDRAAPRGRDDRATSRGRDDRAAPRGRDDRAAPRGRDDRAAPRGERPGHGAGPSGSRDARSSSRGGVSFGTRAGGGNRSGARDAARPTRADRPTGKRGQGRSSGKRR